MIQTPIPLLSSAYLPPVEYIAALFHSPVAYIEVQDHYVKQTYRNRCVIATDSGAQALTIPIEKYEGNKCKMMDIEISEHGNWRHVHQQAFLSAYKQSPFFEYYADEFFSFFASGEKHLATFNMELLHWVCKQIDLEVDIRTTNTYLKTEELPTGWVDLREAFHPKRMSAISFYPYYQVFRDRCGFLPNMSIADLLFCMGPESLLVLREQSLR